MTKKTILTAQTIVTYGGHKYGPGMQFGVEPDDAARFLKSKEAIEAVAVEKAPVRVVTPAQFTAPANDKVAAKAPVVGETK